MDLVCFSHLRWDFVFQRPQHLLTKFSSVYRIFYIEEPICNSPDEKFSLIPDGKGIWIVKTYLKGDYNETDCYIRQRKLLKILFATMNIHRYMLWFYTPMALPLTEDMSADLIIYDCMDELANFKFAQAGLPQLEESLISRSDLIFTGGKSLYNKKKDMHPHVHCFANSIDKHHFAKAQKFEKDPADQKEIPYPRLGFFGVLDERLDIELLKNMCEFRPDWHFIMIGPVVKISEEQLPRADNIHYLGSKKYENLPEYLAGWDIALLPFAINESTEYISPTKTPEYLAALKPVISSPVKDVVDPYGNSGLVEIASTAEEFISAAEILLNSGERTAWKNDVKQCLSKTSWEMTFQNMLKLINQKLTEKKSLLKEEEYA